MTSCRCRFAGLPQKHSFRILLFLLMFFSCLFSGCHTAERKPSGQSPNSSVHTETLSSLPDFSVFSSNLFQTLAAEDSLSLHYTVLHPEAFQINVPPVSFGAYSQSALKESARQTELLLSELHHFSDEPLSENDRFLFALLDDTLQTALRTKDLELYTSPLGPTTGLQTQLPVLLAEYRFSTRSDVDHYFLLLEDLPRFFSELAEFEKARAEAGLGFCTEVLSMLCDQCSEFIRRPDKNLLIAGFPDRLNALPDLSSSERAALCLRNQNLVFTKVIPAYETLISALSGLSDPSVSPQGLCAFPNGKLCYEALVRQKTGSDKSIEEIENLLENTFFENLLTMVTLHDSPSLQKELEHYLSCGPTTDPAEATADGCQKLLSDLKEKISADFPSPAAVSCHVSLIHPSLAEYISPALYLVPPLDGYTENVIYLNTSKCKACDLFSTLAHEGYPGHLYQNTFFAAEHPHPLRMLLNYTGYDEGWATYAELFSYRYADCSEELRQFLSAEQLAGLCLYSLSDLKIHYLGESREEVLKFLTDYGLSSEDAEEVYFTQLAEPGSYLPYSVGCLEFLDLQKEFIKKGGKTASLTDFHTFVLKTGPAPFSLLHEELENYFP